MKQPPKVKPLCPPGRPPRYEDVPFAEVMLDNGEPYTLKMDIYQDLNQKSKGPCIIYYFGGGWMWGEYKQVTQKAVYCRELIRLVEQGYTIVSPSYRLVTQSPFPACIHDCKAVVRYIKAHADEYHIDSDRIGVLGNSAGGHLAAMVAMSADDPELEGDIGGNLEYSSSVKAATIYYAPTDLLALIKEEAEEAEKDLTGTEVDNRSGTMGSLWPHVFAYPEPEKLMSRIKVIMENGNTDDPDWKYIELAKKCSPVSHATADCPPILILHGGQDPLVPISQSESLYKALVQAKADVMYLSYSQAGHGPTMGDEADQIAYRFLTSRL